MTFDWMIKRLFNRPSIAVYSRTDGPVIKPKGFTKEASASRYTPYGVYLVAPLVALLLGVCFPFNIAGTVVPIVVDPANGHTLGTLSDIGKKNSEITPAITNSNPAPPIVLEVFAFRVEASSSHVGPCVIRSTAFTNSVAMYEAGLPDSFKFQAATRLGLSTSEVSQFNNDLFTAITETRETPSRVSVVSYYWVNFFSDFKSSKTLTNDRDSFGHIIASFNVVFSGERPALTGARRDYATPSMEGNT